MNIKFVVFDFDGVFTDGNVRFNNNIICKSYNVKDGKGIHLLKKNNIKVGLLSNFNTKLEIKYSNSTLSLDQNNFKNHLGFDYFYIGKEDKKKILNNWINELNINMDNIAYIGDDINDIEILKESRFSACPYDAVDECKEIVDYICKKKGGEGCVREFVDKIIDNSCKKSILHEIKREFNYQINNFNLDEIKDLSKIIKNIEGNIYFCGVGKSGNIAKHCSDLLKSISYPSFYFDVLNSTHGDIGVLNKKDIIILFSNSGNTNEIINLIPLFKNIGIKIIGICCNKDYKYNNLCDLCLVLPFKNEISGKINKIPTNSYMSQLLFCNILVSILKDNISIDEYKENHLSGNIGNNLLKIKDILLTDFPKIVLNNSIELNKILLEMTRYKIGCCFFVDNTNKLLGLLTDGDIRRLIIENNKINNITINNINKEYYYETDLEKFITDCKNILYIPIIRNNIIVGILYY